MKFEIKNGFFRYKSSEKDTLSDVSFSVESGEIAAILGPNGAGKTTLLRCALGLLNWKSGGSFLDGKPVSSLSARTLWQSVAYVPQAKAGTVSCSVEEMVLLGRSSRISAFAAPSREDVLIANELISRFNLESIRNKKCSEISGGELQMVLIARALAAKPQVLVLDEPESNLDFKNQLLVLDTISALADDGMAVVFNTHYPAHALQRAAKSLILGKDGSFVFGETDAVVTEANIRRFFGVNAVIGEIETDGNIYPAVLPLSASGPWDELSPDSARTIATLSVIMPDRSKTEKVNAAIHEASPYVIGRMGLPYPDSGVYIIQLALDGPSDEIRHLTARLNLIPGISVKTAYAKEVCAE